MYYYIFNNKEVKCFEELIDVKVFKTFKKMTKKQISFYENYPYASIEEIIACKLNVPNFDCIIYKQTLIDDMSRHSLYIYNRIIPVYKLQNALLDKLSDISIKYYDEIETENIISKASEVGQSCRTLFYNFCSAVEQCETKEQMDECFDNYRVLYNEILSNNI